MTQARSRTRREARCLWSPLWAARRCDLSDGLLYVWVGGNCAAAHSYSEALGRNCSDQHLATPRLSPQSRPSWLSWRRGRGAGTGVGLWRGWQRRTTRATCYSPPQLSSSWPTAQAMRCSTSHRSRYESLRACLPGCLPCQGGSHCTASIRPYAFGELASGH
jgi:hypothetical protein